MGSSIVKTASPKKAPGRVTDGQVLKLQSEVTSVKLKAATGQEPTTGDSGPFFYFGRHKTTEQTQVLSQSDVYSACISLAGSWKLPFLARGHNASPLNCPASALIPLLVQNREHTEGRGPGDSDSDSDLDLLGPNCTRSGRDLHCVWSPPFTEPA
jgi:hypothetical protein